MTGLADGTRGNFAPTTGVLGVLKRSQILIPGNYVATVAGITLSLAGAVGLPKGSVIWLENRSSGVIAFGPLSLQAGQAARAIALSGAWDVRFWDTKPTLTFAYNGTPLASNSANPLSAGGLLHYLGIKAGNGSWVNPSGTSYLTSAASSLATGTTAQLSDRVASGQAGTQTNDVASSWFGWQFDKPFVCKSFWIQLRGDNTNQEPRSFQIQVSTGTTLTSSSAVSSWTNAASYTNQTQITGLNTYHFLFISAPTLGNQIAFQLTGVTSSSQNYLTLQEIEFFGNYYE